MLPSCTVEPPSVHEYVSKTPSTCTSSSQASSSGKGELKIPDHWRPEIEQCIAEQKLTQSARNEIVRTLASDHD